MLGSSWQCVIEQGRQPPDSQLVDLPVAIDLPDVLNSHYCAACFRYTLNCYLSLTTGMGAINQTWTRARTNALNGTRPLGHYEPVAQKAIPLARKP